MSRRKTSPPVYQTEIQAGRMVFNGQPCEDLIDTPALVYRQRAGLPQERAVALAFRAGLAAGRLEHGDDQTPGVIQYEVADDGGDHANH